MPYGTSNPSTVLGWFGGGRILTNATEEQTFEALMEDSVAFGIGCGVGAIFQLIFCAISVDILNHVALKSISRIRIGFLNSVLRQDMAWYDTNTSDNFAVRITE
jgi:ATP-binding cassette subfamily B (MDR/TAP) protein 1